MSGRRWRKRSIGVLGAGFAVSTAMPIVASLVVAKPPLWAGLIDVTLAFFLVAGGLGLGATAKRPFDDDTIRTAYRGYRGLAASCWPSSSSPTAPSSGTSCWWDWRGAPGSS